MTPEKLEQFLVRHDLSNAEFARLLGVTGPAVDHWLLGRRAIPLTTVRLLKLFDRKPELMLEFGK